MSMSAGSYDNLKALIVEDNAHMRVLLRSLLQALGLRSIHESSDGASGFAELCARNPDIVLTDLSMEPTDGIHLTKQIRMGGSGANVFVPRMSGIGHLADAGFLFGEVAE